MVLEATTGATLNSFHAPEFNLLRSEPYFRDYGHSFVIPWVMPHTAGYWNHGTIPTEKKLITRDDPEFFATNNIIRSTGGMPVINPNDTTFQFDRSDYTYSVPGGVKLGYDPQKQIDTLQREDERAFKKLL